MNTRRQANSNDFAFVDYQLQLITGISSIKIITLYRIAETQIHPHAYQNNSVIDITDFPKEYVQRVINKTLPLTDLIISCGHLNIHEKTKSNKVFSFLLGHVALGKIGTHHDNQSQLNSLFIQNQNSEATFEYNFFIHSHDQYKIQFEVHFTIGEDRQFKHGEYKCALCENRTATIFCKSESLYFCDGCSIDHHRAKIMHIHDLQKVDKINTLPLCKSHTKQCTYYCLRCQRYLCEVCLHKGNSHGNHDHPVYLVSQLYAQKRNVNEMVSSNQHQKLSGLFRSLHLKRQQIKDNYNQTKDYINKQYEKAISILDQNYNEKLTILKSDQIQLKMLNDKLQWSKTFIKFQQKNLKPIFYFQSQQKFQRQISKMRIRDFQSIFQVKGDLVAQGQILVTKKDQLYKHVHSAPSENQLHKQIGLAQSSKKILHQASLYDYNQSCEFVDREQLFQSLQKSNLNFFVCKFSLIQWANEALVFNVFIN